MKLHAANYVSPDPHQGTFTDVFIEEVATNRMKNKYLYKIDFEMFYFKDSQRVVLHRFHRVFQGNHGDLVDTNRTMIMKYPNPDYDPDYEFTEGDTEEVIVQKATPEFSVSVLQYLAENNNQFPAGFEVVDYGYPNYQDLANFFSGDEFGNENILITNPLAELWFLNQKELGEAIGTQFQFVNDDTI